MIRSKNNCEPRTTEQVVEELFWIDVYSGGTLEQLERKVAILEGLLKKLLTAKELTAKQANALCGWDQYEEVK